MLRLKKEKNIFASRVRTRVSPAQTIVAGFFLLILTGGLLLSLPASSAGGQSTHFLDALFTATSAVCVTGLVVLDTGTYWSGFGQLVILLLIQVGGLGFMSLATMSAILLGRRISFSNRILIQESLNQYDLKGIVKLNQKIIFGTLLIEMIGALLLSMVFVPEFGLIRGAAMSIFHSVSAFCNAGFDLMGQYRSMTMYVEHPMINFTLMVLIILGGLGFTVIFEILKKKSFRRLNLHAKLVLITTGCLIAVPFVLFFLMEQNNTQTIKDFSAFGKFWAVLFQTVSPRTAGFNTLPLEDMRSGSKFLTVILMFIGGSPASTAGGIKTATMAVLVLCVRTLVVGKREVEAGNRRISYQTVNKALAVFSLNMSMLITATMILSISEVNTEFLDVLFESASAVGTAGLTLGITRGLSVIGKIVIMLSMFAGRVGTFTILLALSGPEKKDLYRLPEEKVIVG